jgi:hypothetical protein
MTRAVLAPHLDSEDRATVLTGLFGDTAVDSLGYPAMGLAERAGLALALHDAAAHARGGRR